MNWKKSAVVLAALCGVALGDSVVRERPAEWDNLVPGGQFKDLFLPIPIRGGFTDKTWGGDNVKPRDVTNGIEDPEWSYWCGYPIQSDDGRYHLYTARWPENHARGHFGYFDSEIVHAVADDPMGPYRYKDWIGAGHNPELYKNAKGEWMIYCTHGFFYYSKELDGPWKKGTYIFDKRERYAFKNFVNFSFVEREDESFLAVSRRGYMWVSPDGREHWFEVSSESVYPKVTGIFEDPVIWKDNTQYNMIVNDWKGRIAYHLRSKDGFHWVTEPGEAYVPGIFRYENGIVSDWYKFERIRFLQDKQGRPTHVHFAVIDTDKHSDLPNDEHSSKLQIVPMIVGRLLEVISVDASEIRVKVNAEDGFDPHQDMDLESLRFGNSSEVGYGRGSKVWKTEKSGEDLILTFGAEAAGFTPENFAGKLLGKDAAGRLLFGWARLPNTGALLPCLSALAPRFEFTDSGLDAYVEVTNFGQAASETSGIKLMLGDKLLAEGSVRPLQPFEKALVRLPCLETLKPGSRLDVTVVLICEGVPTETFTKKESLPGKPSG